MELDDLKQRWRTEAGAEPQTQLHAGWLDERVGHINREVRRRLRREAAIYVPIVLAPSALMLMRGVTGTRLVLVAGLTVAVSAIVATLWYSERRLTATPLDGSLREVLTEFHRRVEQAGRAYEVAYVGFIACAVAVTAIAAWRQTHSIVWVLLAISVGGLAVVWAGRSGRVYVDRMFGPYRAELSECTRELEE